MPGPSHFQPKTNFGRINRKWVIIGIGLFAGGFLVALISAKGAQNEQFTKTKTESSYTPRTTKPNWGGELKAEEPPPVPVQSPPLTLPLVSAPQPMMRPAPVMKTVQQKPPPQPKPKQERKSAIIIDYQLKEEQRTAKNDFVLDSEVQPLPSPYTVLAGNIIPSLLITPINAELPGGIKAQVSENVYDTVTQTHLLIPQGSIVLGAYNHELIEGQRRVLVVWNRLIFPNGSSMKLGEMDGSDVEGYAGFTGKVNTHFLEVFSRALALSIVSAATGIAQNGTGGQRFTDSYNSPGSIASAELGRQLGQTSNEMIRQGLNRKQEIQVPQAYLCNVMIKKDLVFTGPYK